METQPRGQGKSSLLTPASVGAVLYVHACEDGPRTYKHFNYPLCRRPCSVRERIITLSIWDTTHCHPDQLPSQLKPPSPLPAMILVNRRSRSTCCFPLLQRLFISLDRLAVSSPPRPHTEIHPTASSSIKFNTPYWDSDCHRLIPSTSGNLQSIAY